MFAGVGFALVLLGAGLAYELWKNGARLTRRVNSFSLAPLLAGFALGTISLSLTSEIFWEGLKAGLVTFGGAFTVIPFLHDAVVGGQGWLTESQFVDGLAIGGALPGPLVIFSTFAGYIAGGMTGAIVITLGIFLPAFVLPIFFHRGLVAITENQRIQPFLFGVAAGVTGLIAAVTVDIVDTSVVDRADRDPRRRSLPRSSCAGTRGLRSSTSSWAAARSAACSRRAESSKARCRCRAG